ncbi:hypothetical protein H5410_002786 [Solanum commersonii]|uniref:Uncharacterized protein n=1 Tax=Solanum commersonii TaxID=4109 RepID=A0A9J6B2U1_SOLCO|nr:hypothetical protein H5410_002786 [Solanum commersonii]
MIIPEKIEKQKEIQKIEIPEFYARKRVIGLATILNELATNYLSGNAVWSYYSREQTMIYSNCRETRPAAMEEIRQWVLSLLKPEQKPTTRAIRQNFISTEIMKVVNEKKFQKLPNFVRNIETIPKTESMKPDLLPLKQTSDGLRRNLVLCPFSKDIKSPNTFFHQTRKLKVSIDEFSSHELHKHIKRKTENKSLAKVLEHKPLRLKFRVLGF